MKSSILAFALATITHVAVAAPSGTTSPKQDKPALVKRASITEAASVGYATLNGGTTGGAGGTTTTVSTFAQFSAAATSDDAMVIIVEGSISDSAQIHVTSNKSIIGKDYNAVLTNIGLYIKSVSNVIIRNLTVKEVLAENGDAIGIQASNNVWVDHCDLSSNLDHDKDYYDGLLDITHASDYVTVTNTFLHDHWKASLIGHSDSNGDEDTGHLLVTYDHNYWYNINSRTPSYRFGTGHIINSYYLDVNDGINTRDGAELLVESNQFVDTDKPLYSTDDGYAVSVDNDFGDGEDEAEEGDLTTMPYDYTLLGSANVYAAVYGTAGATLTF